MNNAELTKEVERLKEQVALLNEYMEQKKKQQITYPIDIQSAEIIRKL